MGVAVRVLNLVPVWKLQWWGDLTRKMRLVTYGCTDQLFKMWCFIPVLRSLQKSPIISVNDLIIQSEQALFTPLQIHRTKGQTCRGSVFFKHFLQRTQRKSSTTHCYFSSAIEWEVEKFTAQLYNLFLFSLPQLEWWSQKDVSSIEI